MKIIVKKIIIYIILKYFKARIAKYMITKKITPAEIICAILSPFGIYPKRLIKAHPVNKII